LKLGDAFSNLIREWLYEEDWLFCFYCYLNVFGCICNGKEVKKMRIGFINLVLGILLLLNINVFAQDNHEEVCSKECSIFTASCTQYVECMVAKSTCLSNCMQRKVWEKVVQALDKLTTLLEKQAKEKEEKGGNTEPYSIVPLTSYQTQNATQSSLSVSGSMRSDEEKEK
jgi:hypothetical protein